MEKMNFLKVYQENKDAPAEEEADGAGIKDGQVKYKRDAPEVERDLKMPEKGADQQPVIEELSSTVFSDQKSAQAAEV